MTSTILSENVPPSKPGNNTTPSPTNETTTTTAKIRGECKISYRCKCHCIQERNGNSDGDDSIE